MAILTEMPCFIFSSLLTAFPLYFPKPAQCYPGISTHTPFDFPQCRPVSLRNLPVLFHEHILNLCISSTVQCLPQTHAGLGLIHLTQSRSKNKQTQVLPAFPNIYKGCSVLAFPQCRIRSSERNFLEVMNPLKPLPGHHT